MPRGKTFTAEQIIGELREAEASRRPRLAARDRMTGRWLIAYGTTNRKTSRGAGP